MSKYTPEQVTEHRRAWIDALRSGEYPQTKFRLVVVKSSDPDQPVGYCCLGVACDLYGMVPTTVEAGRTLLKSFDGADAVLPNEVQEWLGLADNNPTVGGRSLTSMNDNGATFADIADHLEAIWFPEDSAA